MATELSTRRGEQTTNTGLATTTHRTAEMGVSQSSELARAEIEGAIIVAKRFPRNEEQCFERLMKSCQRKSFAEEVEYSYPRGGNQVEGLSVYFAREAARIWGNIRWGSYIVHDDDDQRTIRAWAWDCETNAKAEVEDTITKLIQRRQKNGSTTWVRPDERDLRELTNNRAARNVRNCILELLPEDLKRDAQAEAAKTRLNDAADNIEEARKRIIMSFSQIGIGVAEVEKYLGHKLSQSTPAEVANLRSVWKSLKDGNSQWSDYVKDADATTTTPPPGNSNGGKPGASASDFTNPKAPQGASGTASQEPAAPAEGELTEDPTGRSAAKKRATRSTTTTTPAPQPPQQQTPPTEQPQQAAQEPPPEEQAPAGQSAFQSLAEEIAMCTEKTHTDYCQTQVMDAQARKAVTNEEAGQLLGMIRAKAQELGVI